MIRMNLDMPTRPGLAARAAMTLAALLPVPILPQQAASAGVVNGVQIVDDLTIYLGVVPAAVTRGHAPQHPERSMHGGVALRARILRDDDFTRFLSDRGPVPDPRRYPVPATAEAESIAARRFGLFYELLGNGGNGGIGE